MAGVVRAALGDQGSGASRASPGLFILVASLREPSPWGFDRDKPPSTQRTPGETRILYLPPWSRRPRWPISSMARGPVACALRGLYR